MKRLHYITLHTIMIIIIIIIFIIIIIIIIIIFIIIIIVVIITSKIHLVKCGAMIMYRWMLPKLNENMRLSRC